MNLKEQFSKSLCKPQWAFPKIEDIQPGLWYELTLNPKAQTHTSYSIRDIIRHFMKDMSYLLHAEYQLYPEISTQSTLVHFHGKIRFASYSDVTKFYLNIPDLKEKCTFNLYEYAHMDNDAHDGAEWMAYSMKQRLHIHSLLRSDRLIYKDIPYKLKSLSSFSKKKL